MNGVRPQCCHGNKDVALSSPDTYWIGLTDVQEEGTYIWMTSRTMPEYTNWEDGEPNNFHMNENCVEIRMDGTWNDDVCHSYNRYICEKINE